MILIIYRGVGDGILISGYQMDWGLLFYALMPCLCRLHCDKDTHTLCLVALAAIAFNSKILSICLFNLLHVVK